MTSRSPAPTVTLAADRTLVRQAGGSTRYLRVRVVAPPHTAGAVRPPVHVAFSLDRSGSMAGGKLELAKQAVSEALGFLGRNDRFAVVTFDDQIEVVAPSRSATAGAVREARTELASVDARGSTALCQGWLTACAEIGAPAAPSAESAGGAAVTRCFLLTDGQANVGETEPIALAHHAEELRRRGVQTATFGLGDGFNEELLQGIAAGGGGHFYFIETAAQIRDFFTSELGEALDVVGRDVRLVLHTPGVRCEPLTAYAAEALGGDRMMVRLGDLVAEQVVDVVLRLKFPDGASGSSIDALAEILTGGQTAPDATAGAGARDSARFTFAGHGDNDRQARNTAVDRVVAEAYAASARRVAVAANRAGDYRAAQHELLGTARHIASYAHGDAALLALAEALTNEARHYAAPMPEIDRKRAYAAATSSLKGRDGAGKARRE